MVCNTAAPGVKPVVEPQRASTGEAEPRKCGSIRLRLPFTALPPAALGGAGLVGARRANAEVRRGRAGARRGATEAGHKRDGGAVEEIKKEMVLDANV
jgi:hypothetical protein